MMLKKFCRHDSQCLAILIPNREGHRLVVRVVSVRSGDWKFEGVSDSKLTYIHMMNVE